MALCPFAVKKLITPGSNDPRITPTQVILHVAVSEGASLHEYFRDRSGGIESHFYVRRDGTVEQYRDTDYEADANYTANCRAISIETQGMGDGEWTPAQLKSLKRLIAWAKAAHGVPLRPCPSHDEPGVGYHVMFGAPGPWTPVAKSCPGPDRVRQFNEVLVPWLRKPAKRASRIARARLLLEAALKPAGPRRTQRLLDALKILPKK